MKVAIVILLSMSTVRAYSGNLRRVPERIINDGRIVGGQLARAGQYPWQAAIYKYTEDGIYFCGGCIFNEQWILTAAQCVENATQFRIQLGSNQLEGEDSNRLLLTSTQWFREPRWDPLTLRHDVGLIKLRMPLTYTDYIQPISYLSTGMNPIYQGRPVEIAGWGQTSDTGELVNDLHYVDMTIVGQTNCKMYYGEQLWGSMTCAEGNYNEGPCFGDIGSPLLGPAPVWNHSILYAVASFVSYNGCDSLDPTGYTRSDSYFGWIRNTTRDN